jgi:hypothetical protein
MCGFPHVTGHTDDGLAHTHMSGSGRSPTGWTPSGAPAPLKCAGDDAVATTVARSRRGRGARDGCPYGTALWISFPHPTPDGIWVAAITGSSRARLWDRTPGHPRRAHGGAPDAPSSSALGLLSGTSRRRPSRHLSRLTRDLRPHWPVLVSLVLAGEGPRRYVGPVPSVTERQGREGCDDARAAVGDVGRRCVSRWVR